MDYHDNRKLHNYHPSTPSYTAAKWESLCSKIGKREKNLKVHFGAKSTEKCFNKFLKNENELSTK